MRAARKIQTAALLTVVGAAVVIGAGNCGGGRAKKGSSAAGQIVGPFRLGEQVRSRATMSVRLEMGGHGKPQEMEVSGVWVTTPTDIRDGQVAVACSLAEATVHLGQAGVAGDSAQAERELARGLGGTRFYLTYRSDGTAAGLWFPRGTSPGVANLLVTLAGAQQVVQSRPPTTAWVVTEHDANGEYLAAYHETAPGHLTKLKARYLAPEQGQAQVQVGTGSPAQAEASAETTAPSIHIQRSEFALRTDPRGRLLEMKGSEALVMELGAPGLVLTTTVELAISEARTLDAKEEVGSFARERDSLEPHALQQRTLDGKGEVARRDHLLLAGADLTKLRAELAALPTDAAGAAPEAVTLTRRFEALFRTDPGAAQQAPALVRQATGRRAKIIVDALSLAQVPASQRALGTIARDTAVAAAIRGYAVQYIGHQQQPSQEVVAAIATLLDDGDPALRQMARFSYGICAYKLRAAEPARTRRIVEDLLHRLAATKPGADQTEYVVALGNAGDVAALDPLRRLIDGGEPSLRPRAVEALRFIDDPTVDPWLLTLLTKTNNEAVRLAAIAAIRPRAVGPFAVALAEMARSDPGAGVRGAAIALLGDRLTVLPTARPVLEDVRKTDAISTNRAMAARYLTAASGSPRH
jgi:hypothetical protein